MMHDAPPVDSQITQLFVYGTLRRRVAQRMARILALKASYVGAGQVVGRLYWLGRYPGLVHSPRQGEWVKGDLYELKEVPRMMTRLDRYEGLNTGRRRLAEYERVLASIRMDDGTTRKAWVYHYCRPVLRLRRMVSGDFLRQ